MVGKTAKSKVSFSETGAVIAEKGEEADISASGNEDHEDGSDIIPGTVLPSVVLFVLVTVPIVWYKKKFSNKKDDEN